MEKYVPYDIYCRLKEDFSYVQDNIGECLGVVLRGSQNYNISDEHSDIDTIAIVIPNFDDYCLNKPPINYTIDFNNGKVEVKDVRLVNSLLKKQNINTLEILFTHFVFMSPTYGELFEPFFDKRDRIARYNSKSLLNGVVGCIHQVVHDILTKSAYVDPDNCKKVAKSYSHLLRYFHFLQNYVNGIPFKECLVIEDEYESDYLVSVKRGNSFTDKEARYVAMFCDEEAIKLRDKFLNNPVYFDDKQVEKIMDDTVKNIIFTKFREEM